MTAELWLHRPCVHGHEGSWKTHPPVAAMLSGDESPCEGGRPRVRLKPEKVVFSLWAVEAIVDAQDDIRVWDIIEALGEEDE